MLLVFLDGVGFGEDDPVRNPLVVADLPTLRSLMGGRPPVLDAFLGGPVVTGRGTIRLIDAQLGVHGRPQSGTGQTALLTGVNAPARFGRHFGPWVPTALRELLIRVNLFSRAVQAGASVAFANAYPLGHMEAGGRGVRRPGAFPLAAHSAGVLVRDERSVREGQALVSSITTDSWRRFVDPESPRIDPVDAGRNLAAIACVNDLTVFAHYDTDYIGHRGGFDEAVEVIERVDAFLGGIVASLPDDVLLLLTSDHGNLEDVTVGHTSNAVPLIAVGREHRKVSDQMERITDLTPVVVELMRQRVTEEGRAGGGMPI